MNDMRLREALEKYYTDLEYGMTLDNKREALEKISTLADKMEFTDVNDFSDRFLKTASIIEKHLSLFQAACEHPDAITTIIEYLNYFSVKFTLGGNYDEEYEKDDVILLVIFTILAIQNCNEFELYSFFENAIIKNSDLKKSIRYDRLIGEIKRSHTIEIILLEDSDLYAVIRYLRNRKSIFYTLVYFQVWVQEPIKEKFLWLVKEYLKKEFFSIYTFRTKKELLTKLFTTSRPNTINITSIWTENVVFAKNLAMPLNRDVIFINTGMDFYGGIVLLPYTKICDETFRKSYRTDTVPDFNNSVKKLSVQKNSVYNLFYNGMLQQPVKDTYWIHNDSQWANATSDDIAKCIKSAEEGFKIWSNKSIACRMQILSKLVSTLERNGKSRLADIISTWIKFSCIYENSLSCSQSNTKLEVTKIRDPRGIIILKETDEGVLFTRLIHVLTTGNSVIVICDTNSCSLVPYCNMFPISNIPPGVINLLSSKNINELELSLCGMDYASYAERLFSVNNYEKIYINLTKLKQIIVPLK